MVDTIEITDLWFFVFLTDFSFIFFRYYYADYIKLFGPNLRIRRNCVRPEIVSEVQTKP
jgi:hypothetical protein